MSEREEYRKKLKARLDEMDAEIDKLQAKARRADAEASLEAKQQMTELREKRDEARNKFEQLGKATGEASHDIKTGAEAAWNSLNAALDNARSRYR